MIKYTIRKPAIGMKIAMKGYTGLIEKMPAALVKELPVELREKFFEAVESKLKTEKVADGK